MGSGLGTITICQSLIDHERLVWIGTGINSRYCHIVAMNFYPPPPVLTAELYLRIPDEHRCIGQPSEWRGGFARPFQHIFLEGPVADDRGNLYVVDIPYGRILRISPEKAVCVCASWDGEPNGLAATTEGTILIADYKNVSVDCTECAERVVTHHSCRVSLNLIQRHRRSSQRSLGVMESASRAQMI